MKHILIAAITLLLVACTSTSSNSTFNVLDYGAKGDGSTDDAAAIQKAIDQCNEEGGGTVLFPKGHTFMAGPIQLKSNVEIHLEVGATLLANPDESIYQLSTFGDNRGEGMMWLWCDSIENLAITGRGTIDGNGVAFMGKELEDSYELKELKDPTFDPRPHVLTLKRVNHLTIRDITIREGAYWTVHLIGCYDALIEGISLLNNLKIRNGDGIDIDHSRKVRIANCFIESGDDCICLKNRREYAECGPCQDIVVTNCVMTGRSCAIKIGSENMDSISHVIIENCVIKASNRGLGIQNRDEGTVSDVLFANIILECQYFSDVWWGKAEPIYVTSYPRAVGNHKDAGWRFPKGATEGRCGEVSDITFHNIIAKGPNGCFIGGDTPDKVQHIHIDGVITLTPDGTAEGNLTRYDRRPCVGEGFVQTPLSEIYVEQATDVTFNGKTIQPSAI